MAGIHSQRLILKDPDVAAEDLYDLALNQYWLLVKQVEADSEKKVSHEAVWRTEDKESTIHYVEDRFVHLPYLFVRGENMSAVLAAIRKGTHVYSEDELIQLFDDASTPQQKKQAIARLGVGAPLQFNARFFERFQRALQDEDPEIRRAAIWMISYPSWPEFRPLLVKIKENDPVPAAQQNATSILAAFDETGVAK